MPSLVLIVLSISTVVAGPLAVFAPLGLAPLTACVAAASLVNAVLKRLGTLLVGQGVAQAVLFFLIWILISSAWTINPLEGLWLAVRTAFLIAGGAVLSIMLVNLERADRGKLASSILIGYALLIFFLAFELLSEGLLVRTAVPETYAQQPWIYVVVSRGSVFMALMMWPALLAFRTLDRRAGMASVCLAAIVIAVLTDHGATRVGVATGLLVMMLVWWLGRSVVLLIGGLIIAVILGAPLLAVALLSPHSWLMEANWLKLSAIHRLYIWHFVAERIWERPLFGWGFDASRHMPGRDVVTPIDVPSMTLHPHNMALQIWLELGAVGAIGAAVVVALLVRQIARPDSDRFIQATATAAVCAGFVVASLSFGIWQSWWVGTLVLTTIWIAGLSAGDGEPDRTAARPESQMSA